MLRETFGGLCRCAAKVYHRMRHVQVYRGSRQTAGSPQPQARSQTGYPYRQTGHSGGRGDKNNVSAPSQTVQGCICIPVQRYTVILPAVDMSFPWRPAVLVDMPALCLADFRCDCLLHHTRQCPVTARDTPVFATTRVYRIDSHPYKVVLLIVKATTSSKTGCCCFRLLQNGSFIFPVDR